MKQKKKKEKKNENTWTNFYLRQCYYTSISLWGAERLRDLQGKHKKYHQIKF